MNWPVTYVTIMGTLPGLYVGAILREGILRYQENFKFFVGLVLIYIGGRLLYDQTALGQAQEGENSGIRSPGAGPPEKSAG